MRLFRWTQCLQVSCVVVMTFSVMAASLQLLAQAHGKELAMKSPTFYRTIPIEGCHLLQRGRAERRADASPVARSSVIIANVRAALRPAFRSLSPCRT